MIAFRLARNRGICSYVHVQCILLSYTDRYFIIHVNHPQIFNSIFFFQFNFPYTDIGNSNVYMCIYSRRQVIACIHALKKMPTGLRKRDTKDKRMKGQYY